MKTLKSIAFMAGCAVLVLAACQKDPKLADPSQPIAVPTVKTQHCDPWRNVTGYVDLVAELNSFALCNTTSCTGRSLIQTKNNPQLEMAPMLVYLIPDNYAFTPSEQNDIIGSAMAWAFANKPFGYSISSLQYGYDVVAPGPPSEATISVLVTYRKCLGGGGGEED